MNISTRLARRALSIGLLMAMMVQSPILNAASVALATTPLATSTTTSVKPNLLLVLDDSGSMAWDHMPDDATDAGSAVTFSYGYYGLRSSQCNQVYYDPSNTYAPPVTAAGTSYPNATFTSAWTDGFNTGAGTVNLNTNFKASQSLGGDGTGQSAYYYTYSGSQTTLLQKNYNSTTNTFYNECHSAQGAAPGSTVFTKRRLATTETTTIVVTAPGSPTNTVVSGITVNGVQIMTGPSVASSNASTVATNVASKIGLNGYSATVSGSTITITGPTSAKDYTPVVSVSSGNITFTPDVFPDTDATKLQNFANWYSYYRTRILMMKTATGRAFSSLDNGYRVGLMKISNSSTPLVVMDTFESTHRSTWYTTLYAITPGGSTPLRQALSNAGRYFAGKLGNDPMQYSCQQNFSILSTDGYWNTGSGFLLDGSTAVGNQDGDAGRPMFDGSVATSTVTTTYTRTNYTATGTRIGGTGSNCTGGKLRLISQSQTETCSITTTGGVTGTENCGTGWTNTGTASYVPPYTSSNSTCVNGLTAPSPTARTISGTPVTSTGTAAGSSDSLSDVAMYYYKTDLRSSALSNCTGSTGEDVCTNNVFISSTDNNTQQHMTTFTLGLGASGLMNYSSSYINDLSGDYYSVKTGAATNLAATPPICSWQSTNGSACNWPIPGMANSSDGKIENIDDLWHAAVDGRGAYFSATSPSTLSAGLSAALGGINARKGSAAAAATSTLNPVAGDNYAYVASYTTVVWKGNLEARGINTITGAVNENADWCVEDVVAGTCTTPAGASTPSTVQAIVNGNTTSYYCVTPNSTICSGGILDGTNCMVPIATSCTGTLKSAVSDINDTRIIKTANSSGTGLIDFDATYAAANPSYFDAAHIGTLSQWTSLTSAQQTAAQGANLVNFLRGEYGYEDRTSNVAANRLYRYREAVLGDALESQPAFISKPVFSYPYPGYTCPATPGSCFKEIQAGRAGTVYMGANDGMMHAFDASTGHERWAYVPSMVIPNMWKLADKNYSTLHINLVNGSPVTTDICSANCTNAATAVWKTILVSGLNGGGRGYYALDITDPANPSLLWEFTTTAGIGKIQDDDLGYSFGKPVVTRRASDGKWVVVVSSGYNNTSPGTGKGFLYVLDANSGTILSKISTGVGSTTTPSGLAKIAGWNEDPTLGNMAVNFYGGDLLGNLWKFDINSTAVAAIGTGSVTKIAELYSDTAGTLPQPITTTPILALFSQQRLVIVGTGKYLETGDLTTTQTQSIYAIKDNSTTTFVNPRASSTMKGRTLTNSASGAATRTASGAAVNLYTDRGWFVDLPDSGERVNIDSKLIEGTLLTASLVPSNTACSPGGYGWLNFFDYQTGEAVISSSIVSSKYDSTIVGMNVMYIGGHPKVAVVTSSNPTPELNQNPTFAPNATGFTGKRVIWRELIP